jgi:cobalt-precorrin-5B (C1)-methyltransferase
MSERMSEESKPAKVRKGDGRRERGNRTGFTTGACSAAAARAATLGLLNSEVPSSVVCRLPNGSEVSFAVIDGYVEEGRTAPMR